MTTTETHNVGDVLTWKPGIPRPEWARSVKTNLFTLEEKFQNGVYEVRPLGPEVSAWKFREDGGFFCKAEPLEHPMTPLNHPTITYNGILHIDAVLPPSHVTARVKGVADPVQVAVASLNMEAVEALIYEFARAMKTASGVSLNLRRYENVKPDQAGPND